MTSSFFRTLCVVLACTAALAQEVPAPAVARTADIIFHGGPVVTVVEQQPVVEALAIADGEIIAVGDKASVMKTHLPGKTKLIDLQGKTLMPGFVEPHTHSFLTAANIHLMTDVSSFKPEPVTIKWTVDKLKKALPDVPKKELPADETEWLLAFGADPSRTDPFMAELDVKALDEVSRTTPIFVMNQSGHIGYVNTRALQLAGINASTPDPTGGRYLKKKNASGQWELTGVVEEAPAFKAFQHAVAVSPTGKRLAHPLVLLPALMKTYHDFAQAGVTTATEISLGAVMGSVWKEYQLLRVMADVMDTPVRIRAYVYALAVTPNDPLTIEPNRGDDLLKVIGVKFVADGSTQGLSAALNEPYGIPTTPDDGSLNYTTNDSLFDAAKGYSDAGWQLSIHSNGDRTTTQVLDVYRRLEASAARRHRIEHLTVTEDAQLDEIRTLGLTPSMTIGHVYYWGYAFDEQKILGPTRAQRIDPAASLLARHVPFSFNSDSPITPVSPLRYISTAVTRLWQHEKPKVLGEDQKIEIDQAIRAVTLDAAYQLFLEDKIGSLAVGKWADLVILDRNPRDVKQPEDIMKIKVVSTYLSGVPKFSAPPEYGSLQNRANKEYRCNRATHLSADYDNADCRMKLIPYGDGVYAIQNLKNGQFFQDTIGTMADKVESDKQRWRIVEEEGSGYTIRNEFNREYMTSAASQLSETVGKPEYWNIAERPKP